MEGATIEQLMAKVPSKYVLVNLVAKRAKQIKQGVETFVDKGDMKAVAVALQEIAEGYVGYEIYHAEVKEEDKKVLDEIKALNANDDDDIITEEQS